LFSYDDAILTFARELAVKSATAWPTNKNKEQN